MTDKDPNDMTASELLREADSHPCSMCHLVMVGDESCATTGCASWAYRLADKIDAELAKARELSLRRGAELWAKANGWPDFRDGEDFGAWLARCTYKKPVDDCNEPVQFGDDIELHYRGGGVDKGRFQEVAINKGPVSILSFVGVSHARDYRYDSECDILKRPAPEALGADGKPVKEGETVWLTDEMAHWAGVGILNSDGKCGLSGVGGRDPLKVWSVNHPRSGTVRFANAYSPWCPASWLTHTPPDTQQDIDDDATMPPAEYCAVRGIDLGDDPDRATATEAMVLDLLRRQRELDARKGGE